MTDDEVIETFLKENEVELRKAKYRRIFRKWSQYIVIGIVVAFLFLFTFTITVRWFDRRAAARKVLEDEAIAFAKIQEEVETNKLLVKTHIENQYAYITVQYAADGHAVGCWVTHDKSDVITLTQNTPAAYAYISNYKDYTAYGDVLRMDPKMCVVWHWPGQDP